jgi:hypothetical protein
VYVGQELLEGGTVVDTQIVAPKDQFDIRYTLISAGDKKVAMLIADRDTASLNDPLSRQPASVDAGSRVRTDNHMVHVRHPGRHAS